MRHLNRLKIFLKIKIYQLNLFDRAQKMRFILSGRFKLIPFLPSRVIIDPINLCNLSCPLCPTGMKKLSLKQGTMKAKTFEKILFNLLSVKKIILFNWGEPFLNPDIFEIIKMAKKAGKLVEIHSNFSLKRNLAFLKQIIDSSLDELVISLDGASQETYQKYRRGGNFNLVIDNIKKLKSLQKKMGEHTPNIAWKFIVNKYNENEIEKAIKMANQLEIPVFFVPIGLTDDLPDLKRNNLGSLGENKKKWLPLKRKEFILARYKSRQQYPLFNQTCQFLFNYPTVNIDGKVLPCCLTVSKRAVFGDLLKESFEKIWYNDNFQYSRSLFLREQYNGRRPHTICVDCHNFQKISFK